MHKFFLFIEKKSFEYKKFALPSISHNPNNPFSIPEAASP